jgi:holliday junction DNA helicase RuvA
VIASLRGRVVEIGPGAVVLDVGGVGYLLHATASAVRAAAAARARDEQATLVTHLHVREDALQLFGFASSEERRLFELLLGVPKVGTKGALAIVSGYAPDQVRRAIAAGDEDFFVSIHGIGKKTAQRVVLDLGDKLDALPMPRPADGPALASRDEPASEAGHVLARDALVALGMTVAEAEAALRTVDGDLPVEEQVRLALAGAPVGGGVA